MRIIDKVYKKIKNISESIWFDTLLWIILILFLSLGFFSLGRIYEKKSRSAQNPIEIGYSPQAIDLWNTYQGEKNKNQKYFASKAGAIVYPVGCSKGNRIKEENKIYFDVLEHAINDGYREVEGC